MRKSYLIILALFLTFASSVANGQGCVDMTIKRLVNFDTVDFTATQYNNGIQLTCDFPQDTLTVIVFAPGTYTESTPYYWEEIPFDPPCPFDQGIQVPGLTSDDVWGSMVSLNYATPGATIPFTFDFYGETYRPFATPPWRRACSFHRLCTCPSLCPECSSPRSRPGSCVLPSGCAQATHAQMPLLFSSQN